MCHGMWFFLLCQEEKIHKLLGNRREVLSAIHLPSPGSPKLFPKAFITSGKDRLDQVDAL
jgi:hypothetical protein